MRRKGVLIASSGEAIRRYGDTGGQAPLVPADALFLKNYMRKFLIKRNRILKAVAESDEWNKYV